MFKQRLLSGIVLVIIIAVTLYFGGDVTLFVMGAVSLIGMYELYRVYQIEKCALSYLSYLAAVLYYSMIAIEIPRGYFVLFIGYLMLLMTVYVLRYPKYNAEQIMAAFFGLFYVAIMMSFVYKLRVLPTGGYLVVLIFLSSWGCDTLAYCTGMLVGKHKMSPILSPKKTIEGAIGGVIGAVLLGFLYGLFVKKHIYFGYNVLIVYPVVCGGGAILSMIGDLAASAIKRNHDIKDYGKLIPGHGGILDRFDSMIFTAPTIYYLMIVLTKGILIQ
ncbi:MAG TPA: phosphatidate cytidylyltransferase [Candidatus Scybalomonas excrementigallinarum]|nr:phosphatidate cytidylyltransferase [Candidatus Scybalomonas excrementigallinarum]